YFARTVFWQSRSSWRPSYRQVCLQRLQASINRTLELRLYPSLSQTTVHQQRIDQMTWLYFSPWSLCSR
ncbi:Hypothetical predicted protein, partial [Pelobates cultripes]